jgi:phasin family protein
MSSTDHNKPTGKSGRRKGKAEQRSQKPNRQQTSDQLKISEPDQSLSGETSRQSARSDQLLSPEPDQVLSSQLDQQRNGEPGLLDTEPDQQSSERPGQQQDVQPGQLVSPEPAQRLNSEPEEHQSPKPDQAQDADKRIGASLIPAEIATGAAAVTEGARVNFQSIANAYGDYTRKSLEQTRSFVDKLSGVRSLDKVMEAQAEFAKQSYENFVAGSQRIYELQRELAKQALKPLQRLADRSRDQR